MTVGARSAGLDRHGLVAEVAAVLALLPERDRVVVGASGGPDSAGLLVLLRAARPDLDVVAVHVRHGLRDDRADLAAARDQAAALGVALVVASVTVDTSAGEGLEAAARRARHAALQGRAAALGASAVLLGHTADDQAETVLLRAARGTGPAGLGAMAPWRPHDGGVPVGRPMLRLRRGDVRAVAAAEGLAVVDDPMNADDRFARTVVRHEVLPALGRHAGDPVGALSRLADLARDDAEVLDAMASEVLAGAVQEFGGVHCLPEVVLDGHPSAIVRRVLRVLVDACGGPDDAATIESVLGLGVGRMLEVGPIVVSRGGGWLAFARRDLPVPVAAAVPLPPAPGTVAFGASLAVTVRRTGSPNGEVEQPAARRAGATGGTRAVPPPGGRASRAVALLPAPGEGLPTDAVVRSRRDGDVVRTSVGTRSVQDLLVDHRVPRLVRDRVPVLASGERVLWVAGVDADIDLIRAGRDRPALHLALVPR